MHNISSDIPNAARMYDFFLGGAHNFETDRVMAEKILEVYPDLELAARVNRAFLRRAATFFCEQGVCQFLDLGSGIPTVGNVHMVVQQMNPAARVVYVDIDPVAVNHSQEMLRDNPNAAVVQADVRDMEYILTHETVHQLLDFKQPLGVLLVGILPFITNDIEAHTLVRHLRAVMPSGSYLAVSHGTLDEAPAESIAQIETLYQQTSTPGKFRSRSEVTTLFEGLDLVEPGLVFAPHWQPESEEELLFDQPERAMVVVGVGYIQ